MGLCFVKLNGTKWNCFFKGNGLSTTTLYNRSKTNVDKGEIGIRRHDFDGNGVGELTKWKLIQV